MYYRQMPAFIGLLAVGRIIMWLGMLGAIGVGLAAGYYVTDLLNTAADLLPH